MSHFVVLVIGPDVEKQLQPYHEFECTGTDDEFVRDVDRTEEARLDFAAATETRLKAPDGSLHSFFDDKGAWRPEFSQVDPEAPPFDKERRTHFVPPGYERLEVPSAQVLSFAQFIAGNFGWPVVPFGQQPDKEGEHKYGFVCVDEAGEVVQCIDRTNPNKRWDWWVVGGRWSGFLKLKAGASGVRGKPGVMGSTFSNDADRCDVAAKGVVDFAGMRDKDGEAAGSRWDKAFEAWRGQAWATWEQVREQHAGNILLARQVYHSQPSLKAATAALDNPWGVIDEYLAPRDEFVQAARDGACVPYAVVMNGEWIAKGEMGWFGCSADSVAQEDWNRKVNELLDGLPDDTMLTVVDCHI
jgi:hypothetical protein